MSETEAKIEAVEEQSSETEVSTETEVKESTNTPIIGTKGMIVDETKQMFLIKTNHGLKKYSKKYSKWEFSCNDQKITLSGIELSKRPHERLEAKI